MNNGITLQKFEHNIREFTKNTILGKGEIYLGRAEDPELKELLLNGKFLDPPDELNEKEVRYSCQVFFLFSISCAMLARYCGRVLKFLSENKHFWIQ